VIVPGCGARDGGIEAVIGAHDAPTGYHHVPSIPEEIFENFSKME
jgi:hypothetical protein